MSPLVAYHMSWPRHRDGIERHGLLAGRVWMGRPCGVYVYREDSEFDHGSFARGQYLRWGMPMTVVDEPIRVEADIWQVSYIGPVMEDHYVENGLILLRDPIPNVTLVTRN